MRFDYRRVGGMAYAVFIVFAVSAAPHPAVAQSVNVVLDRSVEKAAITGRVFVVFATTSDPEPRLQALSAPLFGSDVAQWRPGTSFTIGPQTIGFPYETLSSLPAGDYSVQAILEPYTRFARADGHVIWAHDDPWAGVRFNLAPGNLVSDVQRVHWDPSDPGALTLSLNHVIPPLATPADTRWVKHVKIRSELLSRFWGRPIYIGATVLLPRGFYDEPRRKYPAVYVQDHFPSDVPFDFTEQPDTLSPGERAWFSQTAREPGWEFARAWQRDDFPRMVAITWQHPTPYFDNSFAVNSANNGPYQDALLTELVPLLEKEFRLIPDANARFLTGGSAGGYACAALQIQRPDFFGGAWCMYPMSVDFHRLGLVDIYDDTSAFVPNHGTPPWPERTDWRTTEGQPLMSMRHFSQQEAVFGSKSRSRVVQDAENAAFGPAGSDGYPKPLWDERTGTIDRSVAAYWRDHGYDLTDDLVRNWSRDGALLTGKLHVYVGDMDNGYLNLAVYRMEAAAARLENPRADFTFEYGRPMKPHGWQPMSDAELIRMMDRFREARAARRQPSPDSGTQILLLGTAGGPGLHVARSEPATLLLVHGRAYLIDCGIGTMRRLLRAGVGSDSIRTIFITHHHPDHDLGLVDVMGDRYNRTSDGGHAVHIYGPAGTRTLVERALAYLGTAFEAFKAEGLRGTRPSPFVAHDIDGAGLVYRDDLIRVTAVENTHYRLMPEEGRRKLKSFAYRIETPDGVVVFTGDTGPSDAVARLARGADVLVSEVLDADLLARIRGPAVFAAHMKDEHLTEREVADLASTAGVKAVLLYHLIPAEGVPPAAFVAGVKKTFSGPVFAGADLARYCLGGGADGEGRSLALRPCPVSASSAGAP